MYRSRSIYRPLAGVPVTIAVSIVPAEDEEVGGVAVTLTGNKLTDATALKIGGTNCTDFVVASDTSITATAPAKSFGIYDVVVVGAVGSDTLVGAFEYLEAP
jgi:hypothetical protein